MEKKIDFNKFHIAVVMACYNEVDKVSYAVKSILNQTFIDFTFIIVDDSSNDGTYELLQKFSAEDKRIILIKNEENLQLAASLNRGIRAAPINSLIARQDADDISHPKRLEIQLQQLVKNKLDIVGCCSEYTSDITKFIFEESIEFESKYTEINIDKVNTLIHGSLLFRCQFFNEYEYNVNFKYAQDFELLRRASKNKLRIGRLDSKLYALEINVSNTKSFEQYIYSLDIAGYSKLKKLLTLPVINTIACRLYKKSYYHYNMYVLSRSTTHRVLSFALFPFRYYYIF